MADIKVGPSVFAAPPAQSGGKPASSGEDVFAGVLSGRVAALGEAGESAHGVSMAAFAGKGRFVGIPGLIQAKGSAASEAESGLNPALLAAFMGAGAGVSVDPALMGALAGQVLTNQSGQANLNLSDAAEVAADGKNLPIAALSGHKNSAAGVAESMANIPRSSESAGEVQDLAAEVPVAGKLLAENLREDVDPKLLNASIKLAGASAEGVSAAGQIFDRPEGAAMSGLLPQKAGADASGQAMLAVRTPLPGPNWGADFGQKIVWMVGREMQSAQLVLNPPQMGAVEVRLTMTGTEAGAQFFSPHQVVRDAIEAAIPRLRDLMAEAGLSLGQASVSHESFRDAREQAQGTGRPDMQQVVDGPEEVLPLEVGSARVAKGLGLVDLYV